MSKNLRYFILLMLFAGAISSCKKKTPDDIGLLYLPDGDLLNAQFTDSLTLITHTVKDDSLQTKGATPMLLGQINDPLFGVSKSAIYSQFAISKTNPSFGTSPKLDSAILSLVYSSGQYYGTLCQQQFKVYEISEAMSKDSSYYSNRNLAYNPVELASVNVVPDVKNTVLVDTTHYPAHLRIKLDTNFFGQFINGPSYLNSYNNNTAFQTLFKGLYIAPTATTASGQGAILYMDMTNTYSRITLFYHNTTDTTFYYFPISKDSTVRFSHFDHDYTAASADLNTQLTTSVTVQEDHVYIQPMAGLRAKITMPNLTKMFGGKKVAINKAELIMPVEPLSFASPDTAFVPHPKMVATIADSAKGPLIMPDYFEGSAYFGGEYISASKEYKFNIARYVQQVINGTRANQGLFIIPNSRPSTAGRTQLIGGNKALSTRMRLRITYTLLE